MLSEICRVAKKNSRKQKSHLYHKFEFCQCYAGEESFTLACFEGRVFPRGNVSRNGNVRREEDNRHCCEETLGNATTTARGSWFNFFFN